MNLELIWLWLGHASVAVVLTVFSVVVLAKLAPMLKLIDHPGGRKRHVNPTPLVGGIAIGIGLLLTGLVFRELPLNSVALTCGYVLLMATGVMDDLIGLGFRFKLAIQTLCAIGVILSGLRIDLIALDSLGIFYLPIWLSILVSVIAIVGLTNAFNLVDGLDGLLASQVLVTLTLGFGTAILASDYTEGLNWGITIFSVVFCFLVINFFKTSIGPVFFGDGGSLSLGFLIAYLLLYLTQEPVVALHPVAALWLVMYPVFDTLKVLMDRVRLNESPFISDRKHLHYRTVDSGIGSRKTVISIGVTSLVTGALGIIVCYRVNPVLSLILYCGAFWLYTTSCPDRIYKYSGCFALRIRGRFHR